MITPRKMAPYVLGLLIVTITYIGYGDDLTSFFRVSTDNAFVRREMVVLTAPVTGQVIEIPSEEGALVRKGETIVGIDKRQAQIAQDDMAARKRMALARIAQIGETIGASTGRIEALENSYRACREAEQFAGAGLTRLKQLESRGFVAPAKIEEQRGAVADKRSSCLQILADTQDEARQRSTNIVAQQLARSEAETLDGDLKQSRDSAARAIVRAPFQGTLWNRRVSLGSDVQAGVQMYSLVSTENIWIEASFRENLLARIRPGSRVNVRSDAVPSHIFKGSVVAVGAATLSSFTSTAQRSAAGSFVKMTQWVPVRIALDRDANTEHLAAGTSCSVTVVT